MPVLYEDQLMDKVLGAMSLQYEFITAVKMLGNGQFHRRAKLIKPVRSTTIKVANFAGNATSGFTSLYGKIPLSGQDTTIVPLWCYFTKLTQNYASVVSTISVVYGLDFNVGEKILLLSPAGQDEVLVVTAASLNSVSFSPATFYAHNANNTFVVPCLEGLGTPGKTEVIAESKIIITDIKVEEKVIEEVYTLPTVSDFISLKPDQINISSSIKPDREVTGVDSGLINIAYYNTTQRTPLVYSMSFGMKQFEYALLRDQFLAAQGRANSFRIPTYRRELRAVTNYIAGATLITVQGQWYDSEMLAAMPKLFFDWGLLGTQINTVTSIQASGANMRLNLQNTLSLDLNAGSGVSLMPLVYFNSDSLELNFEAPGLCFSTVQFEEAVI